MLGGLLSRQEAAEEEERQLREQQQEQQQQHAVAEKRGDAHDDVNTNNNQYGSLTASAASNGGEDNIIEESSEQYQHVVDDNVYGEEDHSDTEEDYYYDDEDEDSEDDDHSYESSFDSDVDNHDENEDSYLLHSSTQRRRRRRRRKKKSGEGFSFKRTLKRLGSRIRSAVVAIADVDNVWDSPDAANHQRHGQDFGGAYSEDPSPSSNNNANENNNASMILYNVITGGTSTRNRTAAIFWFIFLSTSYASERSTFKLLVDRVGPFRLFSAELILGAHALFTAMGMLIGHFFRKEKKEHEGIAKGMPLADVGLMAILDTVYLLLGVISGAHVPPVLTVILVQATIPLTACFTQCVHPDGRCSKGGIDTESDESSPGNGGNSAAAARSNVHIISNSTLNDMQSINEVSFHDISSIPNGLPLEPPPVKGWGGLSRYHIIGTGLMFIAIFLGLTPAVLSLDHIVITKKDAMPDRTAYNTIVFCFAAIPAAISQLYKEHTMTRLRQPIDRNALNLVLSIFQLLFAIVVSPLAYGLQGMGDGPGWTSLFESKQIGENFSHGLQCFLGTLDEETMKKGYPEVAECRFSATLLLLHVLSIIMVGVAIDKLAMATKVMYRGVSMGIILAVIMMFVYQIQDKWCDYGPLVSFFHLSSTAILIIGAEIYHRVSLVDSSFETVYPVIEDLYEEE